MQISLDTRIYDSFKCDFYFGSRTRILHYHIIIWMRLHDHFLMSVCAVVAIGNAAATELQVQINIFGIKSGKLLSCCVVLHLNWTTISSSPSPLLNIYYYYYVPIRLWSWTTTPTTNVKIRQSLIKFPFLRTIPGTIFICLRCLLLQLQMPSSPSLWSCLYSMMNFVAVSPFWTSKRKLLQHVMSLL